MASHRLSKQGHLQVRQSRENRGLSIYDSRWLEEASRALEPNRPWSEEGFYPYGISLPTWKRFLKGAAIRPDSFKAFCQVLNCNWETVSEKIYESYDDPIPTRFEVLREPQESICYATILQPGSLLRIKAPQHTGKTQMLNRVLNRFRANQTDTQIVVLNFYKEFESDSLGSKDNFWQAFCGCVNDYLDLSDILNDYWQKKNGGSTYKANAFFRTHLLTNVNQHLVLVLEGVDRVFEHPVADDFCHLLRAWHEEAQRDELWKKLSLVIVHSTDNYASIDINYSPLRGVGTIVTLDDFTPEQVAGLVRQYNLDWSRSHIDKIMGLVGGNPFLINHTLKTLADKSLTLEIVLVEADTQGGIYGDRLLQLWEIVKDRPALIEALRRVVTTSHPVQIDPTQMNKLDRLGLVKIEGNNTIPSCNLYRQYFSKIFA